MARLSTPAPWPRLPAAPDLQPVAPPSPPRRPNRWLSIASVVAVGGLAFLGLTQYLNSGGPPTAAAVPTVSVQMGDLRETIVVSGQTVARRYASVIVPIQRGGNVGQLDLTKLAAGGSVVEEGEVVAQVDSVRMVQQLDNIEDSLSQSVADRRKRRAQQAVEWENLQQTVRSAAAARDRAALENGAAEVKSRIDREVLKLNLEEAEARYRQQRQALPLKQISIEADTRLLELSYARLLRHRDHLANDLKHYTLLSPMRGLVVLGSVNRSGRSDRTQFQAGDQVKPGQTLMKIVDTASMQLRASVNQAEVSRIQVGQPATVTLDAFPGLAFPGKVQSVGALAVAGMRGSFQLRTVPITVEIQGVDPRLIPDLSGAAEIELQRREDVLLLPRESLYEEDGEEFVYLKTDDGFERRPAEVGLRANTHAEILSGLSAGDTVATVQPSVED
jgi:HlyD family secretion protein